MILASRLVGFGSFLRDNKIPADSNSMLLANQAAVQGCLQSRADLKNALRACFCQSADHWWRFDEVFDAYWASQELLEDANPVESELVNLSDGADGVESLLGFGGTSSQEITDMLGAGDYKALSLADFRFVFNPQEMQLVAELVERMAARARKQYLRREHSGRKGRRVDIPASVRESTRTAATVMRLHYRQRRQRLPRFVLLLDVSQSMDVYAKLFLRFIRQLLSVFEQSYAFAFNIELVSLGRGSRQLAEIDIENTLNALSQSWLGGTKIATSLASFNQTYLRKIVNSKTTVVIFSDGYDTDPIEKLLTQVVTLRRCARRLIWVNPLLGRFEVGEKDPRMDPLQEHISAYHSAHNVQSLLELEADLLK